MTSPRERSAPPSATPGESVRGRLVGGRYRLGRVIGRGGMATIHRATDERNDRPVAVKLLRPEIVADRDLAQRFRGEALASTVLRHPNIVACLDTGTDDDQPYIVMELVEGEDLAARLRRDGRLSADEAARIGLDVARAIGAAHLRGIVHRDIKPGNILLATDGRAMVTDFGIARLAADSEANLPGTTLGSVHYFSPEQARGLTTTPASDVYGVGLVLYEALTGQRAWSGDTTDAIVLARVGAPAPSPRTLRSDVPAALDAVVVRSLAPDPAERFPNGAALAAALESIVAASDPANPTAVVTLPRIAATPPEAAQAPAPARRSAQGVSRPKPPRTGAGRTAGSGSPRSASRTAAKASGTMSGGRTRGSGFRAARPAVVLALIALVGVVGGAMAVASFSGGQRIALGTIPTPTPKATPRPTPTPTPRPTPTATPKPTPSATILLPVPVGSVAELCEIFLDVPCGLGAGHYVISDLTPSFEIEIGDGWSASARRSDMVALSRNEGLLTFATGVKALGDNGKPLDSKGRARDLVAAFAGLKGVDASKGANVKIDGRQGRSVDLSPARSQRVALFKTDEITYQLEPDRTTRIVALDTEDGVLVIVIEPADGAALRDILATADAVAGSIRFR